MRPSTEQPAQSRRHVSPDPSSAGLSGKRDLGLEDWHRPVPRCGLHHKEPLALHRPGRGTCGLGQRFTGKDLRPPPSSQSNGKALTSGRFKGLAQDRRRQDQGLVWAVSPSGESREPPRHGLLLTVGAENLRQPVSYRQLQYRGASGLGGWVQGALPCLLEPTCCQWGHDVLSITDSLSVPLGLRSVLLLLLFHFTQIALPPSKKNTHSRTA